MGRWKYENVAKDGNGKVIAEATVSVYKSGGLVAANIYVASSGGSAINSVTTDSEDGGFIFYVDDSDYASSQLFKTVVSNAKYKSKTLDDIKIYPLGQDFRSETITSAAPTLKVEGSTSINSSSNAVNGTLGSGSFIGQIKTIVMTEASASSTISITNHQTSDPEVATFDAVDETGVFMWTGTEWITLFATCTFV